MDMLCGVWMEAGDLYKVNVARAFGKAPMVMYLIFGRVVTRSSGIMIQGDYYDLDMNLVLEKHSIDATNFKSVERSFNINDPF